VNLKIVIQHSEPLVAWGDRKLLERVLDNLVGNAIKFTPNSGTINVTAHPGERRVVFDVADTGEEFRGGAVTHF